MPFIQGQSGNPKGRALTKPFSDALRMQLAEAGGDHKKLRAIAQKLLDMAESGNLMAIQVLFERLEGKPLPANEVSVSGDDGKEIRIRWEG